MLEDTTQLNLDFQKITSTNHQTLIPVVIQEKNSKKVLLLAYLNDKAFYQSVTTKILTLWSRSRDCLWVKGASSGNSFLIDKIFVNCEQNSLLFIVEAQKGGICHTKKKNNQARTSCFYREYNFKTNELVCCE